MTTGFTKETFDFLTELENNNNKQWFEGNRERYQNHWVAPALSFIEAMIPVMEGLDPIHKGTAKINGSLRRINRDVRFSKDKSPYNARLHMIFWTGDHPNKSPAIHIVLHPDHIGYGAGEWGMTPERLLAFRNAVMVPTKFNAINQALDLAGEVGCELDEESLKRLPKGFEHVTDELTLSLLKRKGLVARTLGPCMQASTITSKDGMQNLVDIAHKLAPLNKWLCEF